MNNWMVIASALGAAALLSCTESEPWEPDRLLGGNGNAQEEQLARGRASYTTYCAGCHGANGDGEGSAARFLDPKPRDLRKGKVKFASVAAGEMPSDADLAHTITNGLAGTSMPAWNLVPKNEVDDVVAYIKTFTPNRKPAGAIIAVPADPWTRAPQKGIAEGERLYHGLAACNSCHPSYATKPIIAEHMKSFDLPVPSFRERMYDSEAKDSEWGQPILPPDFLRDRVKSGSRKLDLVRVIAAGVGGTAMPSWGTTLTPKQLWGLAYYVEHLTEKRGSPEAAELRKSLLEQ